MSQEKYITAYSYKLFYYCDTRDNVLSVYWSFITSCHNTCHSYNDYQWIIKELHSCWFLCDISIITTRRILQNFYRVRLSGKDLSSRSLEVVFSFMRTCYRLMSTHQVWMCLKIKQRGYIFPLWSNMYLPCNSKSFISCIELCTPEYPVILQDLKESYLDIITRNITRK